MNKKLPYRGLVLIGFKGCGKTRVGKLLARKLGLAFTDIDTLIEAEHVNRGNRRASVRKIYNNFGEAYFLELEGKALKIVAGARDVVISLGGGSPMNEIFQKKLFPRFAFVYLAVPADTLYARIKKKGFPPFYDKKSPRKSFDELVRTRMPVYDALADVKTENYAKTPASTCKEIMETLGGKVDE